MFGLTTTRRMRAELAAKQAETERQRARAEEALDRAITAERNRGQILRQNRELDAANRRLTGRVEELGRRNSALAESDPEYLANLEAQLAAERKRADHLQRRLDDAVGLTPNKVMNSGEWQPGYQKPKPDPEREVTS